MEIEIDCETVFFMENNIRLNWRGGRGEGIFAASRAIFFFPPFSSESYDRF